VCRETIQNPRDVIDAREIAPGSRQIYSVIERYRIGAEGTRVPQDGQEIYSSGTTLSQFHQYMAG